MRGRDPITRCMNLPPPTFGDEDHPLATVIRAAFDRRHMPVTRGWGNRAVVKFKADRQHAPASCMLRASGQHHVPVTTGGGPSESVRAAGPEPSDEIREAGSVVEDGSMKAVKETDPAGSRMLAMRERIHAKEAAKLRLSDAVSVKRRLTGKQPSTMYS